LHAKEAEWLKALISARTEAIPKGWRKEPLRTLIGHFGGTRLEIGHPPSQDPVLSCVAGAKVLGELEIHRFRLPAPVSIHRQAFLTKHMHPRDPSDLVDQGLGDQLFWKKIHKAGEAAASSSRRASDAPPSWTRNGLWKRWETRRATARKASRSWASSCRWS
jgi:hypothetical protein